MTADPYIGHGLDLQRSDDGTSSGSFATVGTVYDFTPPALSREAVDVSHYGSTERWREFIGGMKDGGEVSLSIAYDPGDTDTTAWLTDINTDTNGYYKILNPDDATTAWGFAGLVTAFEAQAPLDGRLAADVTIKVSGKPGFIS